MSYAENVIPHLPSILTDAVWALANQLQAPSSMIASALLAASSLAVQDKVDIERSEGGVSPVSLNFIVIADSGERKSAVFRQVFKPFFELDEAQRQQHERDTNRYDREMATWRVIKTALEKKIDGDVKHGRDTSESIRQLEEHLMAEPKKVQAQLRIIQDSTTDALVQFLAEMGGSAGLLSDEGGMIFKSRISSNLAPLNSIWSGDGYKTDRLDSSRSYALSQNVRLTTLIMVQPKTFQAFLSDKGELSRDNGYLARALICQPPSRQGIRFISNNQSQMPMFGLQMFHYRIREVLESRKRRTLSLSPDAYNVWVHFYNETESHLQPGGYLHACRDSGSKAPEMARRLAAIFHCISGEEGSIISATSMMQAIGVIGQYVNEFVRLFAPAPAVDPRTQAATELHAWLLQEQSKTPDLPVIEKRKILSHGPSRLRKRSNRDAALDVLRSWRWISEFKQNNRSFVQALVPQVQMAGS